MGLFKCCCKTCEGCGRQMLDQWNVGTGATPKTRWRFAQHFGLWNLYDNTLENTPARCPGCERRFTVDNDAGTGPFFSGWTDWKFALQYTCRRDVDGDLYCSRETIFAAIYMGGNPQDILPDGRLRLRVISGKAYRDCNPAQPEECTHFFSAHMTGTFSVWFARYNPFTLSGSPFGFLCGTLPPPPTVEDIPPRSSWAISGDGYTSGLWSFYPARSGGVIQKTPYSIIRARTISNIAESKDDIVGATGNCGVILIPSKHDPDCCSIWDCPGAIDCTGVPSMNVEVSIGAPPCDGGLITPVDVTTATPSWNIDGGNWELFDVA